MDQHHGSSAVRARRGGEVALATDRPASQTSVVDVTTAPAPAQHDRHGTRTRRTVVDGVTFIHQRFRDEAPAGPPAALLQHFPTGNGTWDPNAPPRTSRGRELLLVEHLDPAAEPDTDVPDLQGLARGSLDFIDVLGLAEADLLGFSLGADHPTTSSCSPHASYSDSSRPATARGRPTTDPASAETEAHDEDHLARRARDPAHRPRRHGHVGVLHRRGNR